MKIIHLALFLFALLFFSCSEAKYSAQQAYKDLENGEVKILLCGNYVPFANCDKAKAHYHITYEHAGVGPTEGVDAYNKTVETYLFEKYGDDFWEQYGKWCDTIE